MPNGIDRIAFLSKLSRPWELNFLLFEPQNNIHVLLGRLPENQSSQLYASVISFDFKFKAETCSHVSVNVLLCVYSLVVRMLTYVLACVHGLKLGLTELLYCYKGDINGRKPFTERKTAASVVLAYS